MSGERRHAASRTTEELVPASNISHGLGPFGLHRLFFGRTIRAQSAQLGGLLEPRSWPAASSPAAPQDVAV